LDQQVQTKELEIQTKETKTQQLETTLIQTELDLANAVLLIQEREAELARVEKELESAKKVKPAVTPPIQFAITDDDADNLDSSVRATNAGFGTSFPLSPQKGDMFLRVDMLPNKPFKWNGQKWIEVDKTTTDRYAYEEEYIQYLLAKIRSKEYAIDDLNPAERDQIMNRLDYQEKTKLRRRNGQ